MEYRLETKSDIRKSLWNLGYPTMVAVLLQGVYDIVDMAWVGRISKEAVAAVTLFSVVFWLFTVLNEIIGASSISMISQSHGKGDEKQTQKIMEQTISFKVMVAVVSMIFQLLLIERMLHLYTDDTNVIDLAMKYGYIRIFFLPMMFASYSVNTIFRCTGESKIPMKIMAFSAFLNLILDPILMFDVIPFVKLPGFGLGVFGAALATVIATTASFVVAMIVLFTGKRKVVPSLRGLFRLDYKIDKRLLTIGLPNGAEVLFRYLANAILIKFIADYGTAATAAAGIGSKLFNIAFFPVVGFMMAGSTLVGHSMGKNDIDTAERIAKEASILNFVMVSTIAAFAMIFAKQVMAVFIDDVGTVELGVSMLRYIGFALMIISYGLGRATVFSGSGYNFPMLVASFASRWLFQLIFLYIVSRVLALPIDFVWMSYTLTEIVEFAVIMYYYRKGTWKYSRVV